MSQPKIAVDARVLVDAPAGVGYYTRAILERLAQRGTLRLTALSHRAPTDVEPLAAAGVEFESLSAPLGYWWQQQTLPRRLRHGDFDLLWSPLGTLPQHLPIPGVVTVHDLTPLLFPFWHSWRNRVSFKRQLPQTLNAAAHVLADSEATAADLHRRFPRSHDRVSVVYPGVDSDFAPVSTTVIESIRRSFDAPSGYALFVGTIEPRKNLHILLDAWQRVRERVPDPPPLLVIGARGWRSGAVRRRLGRAPGVRYLGRLARGRLIEAMQGATLFAFPSLYEGFGLPVAEAMACGVPVVTSDRSSLPEVVGGAGLLVNPQHTQQLTVALERLLTDEALRERLRVEGPARVERFSWDRAATAVEEALITVLRREQGSGRTSPSAQHR